ncbi:IclR family transcriptional regulator [Terrabacter terrae]|uniref:IclR family transcriptional regulator n=1 Tax=Terrabacter terrae TaxID=318434 RepID=UPI0031E41130
MVEHGVTGVAETRVRAVERALSVVEALTDGQPRTLSDLAAELEVPKSTLHGILRTLEARGWLQSGGPTYRLGVRSLLPGARYLEADAVVSISTSILDDLVAEFDETIHLARLEHNEIVYLAKRDSVQPLRLFSSVGRRLPAHATALGKVLLAQRTDEEVDALLDFPLRRLTPNTIVEREPLHRALGEIRQRGYAMETGESTVGLTCTAVLINTGPTAQYALSCSAPDVRITPERHAAILEGLFQARHTIETRLASSPATLAANPSVS